MEYLEKREEKKNKKKGFFITFALHAGVVALLFLPWVVDKPEKKKVDGIVIQMEVPPPPKILKEWGAASERSSKRGEKKETETKKRKSTPKKDEVVKKPEPKPKPKPVPVETKKPKPIVIQEQPKPTFKVPPAPPVEDPPEEVEPVPEVVEEPVEEPVEKPVEETPVEVPTEDPVLTDPDVAGPPPHEDALEDGDGAEESGNEGEGEQGSSETGDSDTDGKADSGDEGDDFSGDGILMRDIVKKANFNSLIKKAGRMVINVCINPNGETVLVEYNYDKSTIVDEELAELAVGIIKRYRFAKDAYAPKRECGSLSYIIDIPD